MAYSPADLWEGVELPLDVESPEQFLSRQEAGDMVQQELDRQNTPALPLIYGHGSPEGVVAAPLGCLYVNQNGGSATSTYSKETAPTPTTGWVAIGTGTGGPPTGGAGGVLAGSYPNPSFAVDMATQAELDTVAAAKQDAATAATDAELAAETAARIAADALKQDASTAVADGDAAGGVLSGTYPNPGFAADMATQAELDAHTGLSTTAHGGIVASTDPRLTDSRAPSGAAGGVLGGTYPNPSFAADMATQAELDAGLALKQDAATAATDAELAAEASARAAGDALAIPKSLVDAKGDLIVATANDTPARRAVGSNGQVLTADSAQADGLKWATPDVTQAELDAAVAGAVLDGDAAGGDLAGTYPNPTIGLLKVTDAKVAAANKDGTAGTPSMRTLGAGSAQAAAGDDTRFPAGADIVNSDISGSAAIARSKLDFGSGLVNTDIATAAAIAYSKLNLTAALVNGDIATAAAIAYSKLALTNSIVNGDVASGAAIAYSKLNLAGSIVNADIASGASIAKSKLAALAIVNADVDAAAAIAYSKLALTGAILNADLAGSILTSKVTGFAAPVSALPSSPYDGQVICFQSSGMATDSVMWMFRYRSAGGTYKWEFIGGPPWVKEIAAEEGVSSTTYANLTTTGPSITLPLAGDWIIDHGAYMYSATANEGGRMSYAIGGAAASENDFLLGRQDGNGGTGIASSTRRRQQTGLTAVAVVAKYRSQGGANVLFGNRWLSVLPRSVG